MEGANPRGQCSLELVLVLIVLTSVVLVLHLTAKQARDYFKSATLSTEYDR